MSVPDLNWLECLGIATLIIHGSLGGFVTIVWLIGKALDATGLGKAVVHGYARYLTDKKRAEP